MLLGLALGIFAQPESVYKGFFDPAFRGLLSILMLVMGMEAWSRLGELRKVAQWYVVYSVVAPFIHGLIAFGLGMIAHVTMNFSMGGVVILAVIASSSSDISGPPPCGPVFPPPTPPPISVRPLQLVPPWRSVCVFRSLSVWPRRSAESNSSLYIDNLHC